MGDARIARRTHAQTHTHTHTTPRKLEKCVAVFLGLFGVFTVRRCPTRDHLNCSTCFLLDLCILLCARCFQNNSFRLVCALVECDFGLMASFFRFAFPQRVLVSSSETVLFLHRATVICHRQDRFIVLFRVRRVGFRRREMLRRAAFSARLPSTVAAVAGGSFHCTTRRHFGPEGQKEADQSESLWPTVPGAPRKTQLPDVNFSEFSDHESAQSKIQNWALVPFLLFIYCGVKAVIDPFGEGRLYKRFRPNANSQENIAQSKS